MQSMTEVSDRLTSSCSPKEAEMETGPDLERGGPTKAPHREAGQSGV